MAKLPLQVLGSLTYFISKAVLIMTRWRGRKGGRKGGKKCRQKRNRRKRIGKEKEKEKNRKNLGKKVAVCSFFYYLCNHEENG